MRLLYDRSIYPEPDYSCPADERAAATRLVGHKQKPFDRDEDDAQKRLDRDADEDDILPGDFATQQEYEDALEEAGINPDDAAPWEEQD
jgi:hypothetical protein